jgi:hypothetical protein
MDVSRLHAAWMFIRYFVEIDHPYEVVEATLLDDPQRWIPGLASKAGALSDALLAEVGFGSEKTRVEKKVFLEVHPPIAFPSRMLLPIEWRPSSAQGLFPELQADLEVAPMGPKRTHLSISARYEPPLGLVGRTLDRAMLHRVAELTVKDFLDRTAAALATAVGARQVEAG